MGMINILAKNDGCAKKGWRQVQDSPYPGYGIDCDGVHLAVFQRVGGGGAPWFAVCLPYFSTWDLVATNFDDARLEACFEVLQRVTAMSLAAQHIQRVTELELSHRVLPIPPR